jgi:hypothetical protein
VTENRRNEKATVHRFDLHGASFARSAGNDHQYRERLMLSVTVAAPLAVLPIVSLVATLRWMATTTRG